MTPLPLPDRPEIYYIVAAFLLAIGIWVCQLVCCIILNLQSGAVVFGLANVITNLMLVGLLLLMCRIERGYSETIDEKPETGAACP